MANKYLEGTGRRKTACASVRLFASGDGTIEINDRDIDVYFPQEALRREIRRPLQLAEKLKTVTIKSSIRGGGPSGQAGALRHGISRALLKLDPDLRGVLKKEGLLTRDPRMKERKKPGQPGARKRFQFSKR